MDDFLGIGFGEFVVILIIGLLILGPGESVNFARKLGRLLNKLKSATSEITSQITREIDEQKSSVKGTVAEVENQVRDDANSISRIGNKAINELKSNTMEISNPADQVTGTTEGLEQSSEVPDVPSAKESGKSE
jgi:Sec-independent protein translocase protein TatA